MKWITSFLLLSFLFLGTTPAQRSDPNQSRMQDTIQRHYWESLSNATARSQTSTQTEMEIRTEAQLKEREFLLKADKFVQVWKVFIREYNTRGAFNVKLAQKASKAFRDLEGSEGWLKEK
jgi:hypothetical protein